MASVAVMTGTPSSSAASMVSSSPSSKPEPVDDERVGRAHRRRLPGGGGEVVRIGVRWHDHLDLGRVAHQVLDHVAQDARRDDHVWSRVRRLVPVRTAAGRHARATTPITRTVLIADHGRETGYHSQIAAVTATDLVLAYGARVVLQAASFTIPDGRRHRAHRAERRREVHPAQRRRRAARAPLGSARRPGPASAAAASPTSCRPPMPTSTCPSPCGRPSRWAATRPPAPSRRLRAEDRQAVDAAMEALAITDLAKPPAARALRRPAPAGLRRPGPRPGGRRAPARRADHRPRPRVAPAHHRRHRARSGPPGEPCWCPPTTSATPPRPTTSCSSPAGSSPAARPTTCSRKRTWPTAYGGHLLRVGEQTLILDDHPHH